MKFPKFFRTLDEFGKHAPYMIWGLWIPMYGQVSMKLLHPFYMDQLGHPCPSRGERN